MVLTIRKVWVGDDPAQRPSSVEVKIGVANDTNYLLRTVKASDGWTLDIPCWVRDYYVEEVNVPAGYVSNVEREGNTFIITNTYMPQTGDSSNLPLYAALLALSAIGMTVLCIKKRRDE